MIQTIESMPESFLVYQMVAWHTLLKMLNGRVPKLWLKGSAQFSGRHGCPNPEWMHSTFHRQQTEPCQPCPHDCFKLKLGERSPISMNEKQANGCSVLGQKCRHGPHQRISGSSHHLKKCSTYPTWSVLNLHTMVFNMDKLVKIAIEHASVESGYYLIDPLGTEGDTTDFHRHVHLADQDLVRNGSTHFLNTAFSCLCKNCSNFINKLTYRTYVNLKYLLWRYFAWPRTHTIHLCVHLILFHLALLPIVSNA